MGRILAIDYGAKRTGVAVSDPLHLIATPLATVSTVDLMNWLKEYIAKEEVDQFVIGDPRNNDGTPTDATRMVHRFIGRLQKTFPGIPVNRVDERFTSKMASRSMVDSGMKKKDRRNKELVDMVSATLILQGFLQSMG